MDRNTLIRWVVIAASILLFWKFGMPLITGKNDDKHPVIPAETYVNAPDFTPDRIDPTTGDQKEWTPAEGELCKIKGKRFDAELSSRGAALTNLVLRDAQYLSHASDPGIPPSDPVSTTPAHEQWRSLRTTFRAPGADNQVKYDRFNWKAEAPGAGGTGGGDTSCRFTYQDADVKIVKTVTAGPHPFELNVETAITNLDKEPKRHAFGIQMFTYRFNREEKGNLGRVPPFQTELSCAKDKEITRKQKDDFKEGWTTISEAGRYAAVSNYYFAQALVPEDGQRPDCRIFAQEYASWHANDEDNAGHLYQARLAYAPRELAPDATATYKDTAFFGPKEREVLSAAAGGHAGLNDLINLGFFSPVAKVLVGILDLFHDRVTFGNWGLAIIVMTLCLRTLLFPLTWKSIKTSIGMRKLKPELDSINAKFADDAQAKHLATMELWKKHGVNPFGGCLPQLVQMPIWFAMYTTLQTAVEMYHTKFLWFADLSAPDKFYILPLVLGAFMILQQRIVPQTGMDPVQQKMMMYLLPAVFTVMMLFLPAALGVYMLTNSMLGIAQQLIVEQLAPRNGPPGGEGKKKGEITVKEVKDTGGSKPTPAFGKGKARV